ncbi:SigE family RNA polymerase sigma factor [Phycicoccus sonneratiae]|uniref:SigE family RNA polymerase sigma factor n=1 Tax=Phycicoccus sonneratiae TaxID=2807628 RepID=A0ABS2CR14_9MICO|nr:SigE family RNA polymerase sigma factor [Phycicoccus sonneraticus]MBM6402316.1 SigE family RNA polymerase sigma factor [Phycicoccus sonneraticus]
MTSERDEEFVEFVRAVSPRLLKSAWFICGDSGQAEELVQAALERVYLRWGHLRDTSPLAYTRRVVLNLHLDQQRRSGREVAMATPPERGSTDVGPEDGDYVVALLRGLPLRERQVVVLRYYVGLSEAEAADALDVSTGTVKSCASRGLAKLRVLHQREENPHVR